MKNAFVASLFMGLTTAFSGAAGADTASLAHSLENDWHQCRHATQAMERMAAIPEDLLTSISVVETGRRAPSGKAEAWPWTINAEGRGYYFATKQEAIRAVRRLMDAGTRSIDIGCMQVNLRFHPRAFTSLEEAFDPDSNVAYAASFLTRLRERAGSWSQAAGRYHSYSPSLNRKYAARIEKTWAREKARAPLTEPGLPAGNGNGEPGMAAAPKDRNTGPVSPTLASSRERTAPSKARIDAPKLRASLANDDVIDMTLAANGLERGPGMTAARLERMERPLPRVLTPARVAMR